MRLLLWRFTEPFWQINLVTVSAIENSKPSQGFVFSLKVCSKVLMKIRIGLRRATGWKIWKDERKFEHCLPLHRDEKGQTKAFISIWEWPGKSSVLPSRHNLNFTERINVVIAATSIFQGVIQFEHLAVIADREGWRALRDNDGANPRLRWGRA